MLVAPAHARIAPRFALAFSGHVANQSETRAIRQLTRSATQSHLVLIVLDWDVSEEVGDAAQGVLLIPTASSRKLLLVQGQLDSGVMRMSSAKETVRHVIMETAAATNVFKHH